MKKEQNPAGLFGEVSCFEMVGELFQIKEGSSSRGCSVDYYYNLVRSGSRKRTGGEIVHVLAVNNSELQVIVVWLDGNRFVDVACSYACSLADLDRGR